MRTLAIALCIVTAAAGIARTLPADDGPTPRIAALTTVYYHNSHADMLATRLLTGYTFDDRGEFPSLRLASVYTDQRPANDISRRLSAAHGFPLCTNVSDALTLGRGKLAVDGVLLIAEHGKYPESDTGQFQYPKRRMFDEVFEVFDRSGRSVPVFCDKHLADNWIDAKWIYDGMKKRGAPLMAGSSLPCAYRNPPVDVERGRPLKEIVATSYHRLDSYGFHALEVVQALAERRKGGETGVAWVQTISGPAVWQAAREGRFDRALLDECLTRLIDRKLPPGKSIEELAPNPVLFIIRYRDGLQASLATLNSAVVADWTAAWRYADDGSTASTCYSAPEWRPLPHFIWQ